MSGPRGALTSFRLHGGGQGAGHEGELGGQGGQDKLSNRLQGSTEAGGESAWPQACAPYPHMHTQHRGTRKDRAGPGQEQQGRRVGGGSVCHKRKHMTHEKTKE